MTAGTNPPFQVRGRNQLRLSMGMLPNHRSQPPSWVKEIRYNRRRYRWKVLSPELKKMIPVMLRKSRYNRKQTGT